MPHFNFNEKNAKKSYRNAFSSGPSNSKFNRKHHTQNNNPNTSEITNRKSSVMLAEEKRNIEIKLDALLSYSPLTAAHTHPPADLADSYSHIVTNADTHTHTYAYASSIPENQHSNTNTMKNVPRLGWLLNVVETTIPIAKNPDTGGALPVDSQHAAASAAEDTQHKNRLKNPSSHSKLASALDMFFVAKDGGQDFRATMLFFPYLYIATEKEESLHDIEMALRKLFPEKLVKTSVVHVNDLSKLNHLASKDMHPVLKVECYTSFDLIEVKKAVLSFINSQSSSHIRPSIESSNIPSATNNRDSALELITDVREYDVLYISRVTIQQHIRVGLWYRVFQTTDAYGLGVSSVRLERVPELVERPTVAVLAFDIECTKPPLKFPDATAGDEVMMISWMTNDGKGYLAINREVVVEDVEDFDHTPKPEFPGHFTVFNEENEKATLQRFFRQVRLAKPRVFVTYNGDSFDWPFVNERARQLGIDMHAEIGMLCDDQNSMETRARGAIHMDCLYWVNRDSYLPQGSRGLKAVTRALLGYDPLELDPEEMTPAAKEQPQLLASYSVSDAVCTYYLYMKYIHPFIFSLCNIIPLNPDDVLRKGSGTLCELLLMGEARDRTILAPNRHDANAVRLTDDGYYLESETYIGGHVEALKSGVYRSDLPLDFDIKPQALNMLKESLDDTLKFAIQVEGKLSLDDITNYEEVKSNILSQIEKLLEKPKRRENPLIYHLDVAAMYPNIILSNRLQPHAIVNDAICTSCDFYGQSSCQRMMDWTWRGEYYPATRGEIEMLNQSVNLEEAGTDVKTNLQGRNKEIYKKRIKEYCRKTYKRNLFTREENKVDIVCQRENPFYVDTVRAFRDRRYEYKELLKQWKKRVAEAEKTGQGIEEAKKMVVLYDSLQLAHKCILNSFYGYVMRKGARWYSMEMAGIVTKTGAAIIQQAKDFIDMVGIPLELDTDGIWCTIPSSFPEDFKFETTSGKTFKGSYICSVFNSAVAKKFSNHQYQTLENPNTFEYSVKSECSIFFEVDGPYKAMVLPASKDEGKSIKKRYAVFNVDGSIAELKGFELKRRGELKLIKVFQAAVFEHFLDGSTLEECYQSVGTVCNNYLGLLDSKGSELSDDELLYLLMEQNNMSKPLAEYITSKQKSSAITTAKRLSDFLGSQMVKDKGLACQYIIANKPEGLQVTERAIPIQIFKMDDKRKKHFLRHWLNSGAEDIQLRNMIDWDYYRERLASAVLKIISIPAALQNVANPVPSVEYPEWLVRLTRSQNEVQKQTKLGTFFKKITKEQHLHNMTTHKPIEIGDLEDTLAEQNVNGNMVTRTAKVVKKVSSATQNKGINIETVEPMTVIEKVAVTEDYASWLQYKKQKWIKMHQKKNVESRKRDRVEGDAEEPSQPYQLPLARRRRIGGIGAYFNAYAAPVHAQSKTVKSNTANAKTYRFESSKEGHSLTKSKWQVVSIVKTSTPGMFRLWILPDNGTENSMDFISLTLEITRTLYLNQIEPSSYGTPIFKHLPRGHRRLHLNKIVISERDCLKKPAALKSILESTNVEGIYGQHMPLDFNAIMEIGNFCSLKKTIKKSDRELREKGVCIDELSRVTCEDYLDENIHRGYFYLCKSNDGRGLYALITPSLKRFLIVMVVPYRTRREIDPKRVWLNDIGSTRNIDFIAEDTEFDMHYVTKHEEAVKIIGKALLNIRDTSRGGRRLLLCAQTPFKADRIPEVVSEMKYFPVIPLAYHEEDGRLDPLVWERPLLKKCFQGFCNAMDWFPMQLQIARSSGIPIGNINPDDQNSQTLDVLFGRLLTENHYVPWFGHKLKADAGGSGEYDGDEFYDPIKNPVYSQSGLYKTVVLETEIQNMVLGTILMSSHVSELEGIEVAYDPTRLHAKEDSGGSVEPLDNICAVAPIFRILKTLVNDITVKGTGSDLLISLYRWIRSESSVWHEPALYRFVTILVKKVFWEMIHELKKLGATVIFANMSKLIIATPRTQVLDALRYAGYLYKTLGEKKLFEKLLFQPVLSINVSMLFVDAHNYCGIPAIEEKAILSGASPSIFETNRDRVYGMDELPETRMKWDIPCYYPTEVRCMWITFIGDFIRTPYLNQMMNIEEDMSTLQRNPKLVCKKISDEMVAFFRAKVGELYESVETIRTMTPRLKFPEHATSYPLVDPSLEFIKSICHVLELEPSIREEVVDLRRGLLRLIGMDEFSEEAIFKNPAVCVELPDIICTYCNHVTDLDLGKLNDNEHGSGVDSLGESTDYSDKGPTLDPWRCTLCDHPRDRDMIELLLLQDLERSLKGYFQQDQVCKKCGGVKADHFGRHCKECNGEYRLSMDSTTLQNKMEALLQVARLNHLPILKETIQYYC